MSDKRIRVLIVDDSEVVRQVLSGILGTDPGIDVVGTAIDPYDAREKIKLLKPDVLTLDVEMPKMDGVSFLKNLMRLRPMPVVMVSTLTEKGASVTLDALEAGAADYVTKPQGAGLKEELERYSSEIIGKVKAAACVKTATLERQSRGNQDEAALDKIRKKLAGQLTDLGPLTGNLIVAIGASTGGTEAIKDVVIRLPENFPPVVVVQHIPPAFSASYAKRLDGISALRVKEAAHGDPIERGNVYIAPGSHHLFLKKTGSRYFCQLSDEPPVNKHRPAVDVLFDSVVETAGRRSVGVILTGMGADGAEGLLRMREAGATTLSQNEATCVVYGMPKAAAEIGAAEHIVPLLDMPSKLVLAVRKKVTSKTKA